MGITDFDKLDNVSRDVLAAWDEWRGQEELPPKERIDPAQIKAALPGIQIVEAVEGPERYRYRLVGTREVEARGHNPAGKGIAEGFFGPDAKTVFANYDAVLRDRRPVVRRAHFRTERGMPVLDVSLFLPFTDDKGEIKFVMVYSYQSKSLLDEAERSAE